MTEKFFKRRILKFFGAFAIAIIYMLNTSSVVIAEDSERFEREILADMVSRLETMTEQVIGLGQSDPEEEQMVIDELSRKLTELQREVDEIKNLRNQAAKESNHKFCDYASRQEDYYFNDFVIIGSSQNKPESVAKVQNFLNQYQGANLSLTGVHDMDTIQAVKIFQILNKKEVLDVWPTEPTGNVYSTTQRTMNVERCGMYGLDVNIPAPNLIPLSMT